MRNVRRRWLNTLYYWVAEHADLLDLDFDHITRRKKRGGFIAIPTPLGVPVKITDPANSVVLPLKNSISVGNIKNKVGCIRILPGSPFTRVWIRNRPGSGISSLVSRAGPRGANVSKLYFHGRTGRHHISFANRAQSHQSAIV